MKINLVKCPTCEANGKTQILGEIDALGAFLVERHHKGLTRISGSEFSVQCSECNEIVYFKKSERSKDGNVPNIGSHGVYRVEFEPRDPK